MSEKPQKQQGDKKQVPLAVFEPPPEDPLPTGEELEAKCRPETRQPQTPNSHPHLFSEENSNIKGSPQETEVKPSQTQCFNEKPVPYVSTGTREPYPTLTLEGKNERIKERMLAFVVSSVLYGVQVPVEMRVEPTVFSNRVNPFLLEAWSEAALKTDPSPKRSGKIQRALERSMVLFLIDAKRRKPDQQLILKIEGSSHSAVYRVCPATLGEVNAAKCASCTRAYGCNFYTYTK